MQKVNFSENDAQKIIAAIQGAESLTSAEIRVHIEQRSFRNPMKRAVKIFHKLKMDQTKLRNGVLIYFMVKKHQFAIIGDKGIHERVPADFWEKLVEEVTRILQANLLLNGICKSISLLGNRLQKYFPIQATDMNELSNEISFGE